MPIIGQRWSWLYGHGVTRTVDFDFPAGRAVVWASLFCTMGGGSHRTGIKEIRRIAPVGVNPVVTFGDIWHWVPVASDDRMNRATFGIVCGGDQVVEGVAHVDFWG